MSSYLDPLVILAMVIAGALAIPLARRVRSWRRRLDGRDTFECGWRVVHAHVPDLAATGGVMVAWPRPFPCRATQEVSVPNGSTPVGEAVVVI